jgi:hypothetical protein
MQEVLAGKLISAIQGIWSERAGESEAPASERIMHASHGLLQAAKQRNLGPTLGTRSVIDYLGAEWFHANPSALPYALALQESVGQVSE